MAQHASSLYKGLNFTAIFLTWAKHGNFSSVPTKGKLST